MHSDSGRCQSPPSALTDQCRIDNAALQLREECARLVEVNHALGHLSFAVGHRDQIGQTMDFHACFEIPQVGQTLHRTLRAGGRQRDSDRVEPVWSREDDLAQVDPTPAILRFGPLERGEVSPSRGARARPSLSATADGLRAARNIRWTAPLMLIVASTISATLS
jgi:hypothetical protein